MHSTSETLLERLRQPSDELGWERFVSLYTPLLLTWATRLCPREQDAADLVQDVFVILVQKLPEFRYDPSRSFRGWLRTIVTNRWRDRQRRDKNGAAELDVATLAAPDELAEFDEREYR